MSDAETVTVNTYADLAQRPELAGREIDIVAGQLADTDLQRDGWLIAWIPEWLLEEKREESDIQTVAGSKTIIAGRVDTKTAKAYLLETDGGEAWLPKSVITVFERAENASIDIPQRGLGDFAQTRGDVDV